MIMANKMITVTVKDGKEAGGVKEFHYGTKLIEVADEFSQVCSHSILIAKVNNELCELYKELTDDCEIEFFDFTNPNGLRVYQRSVSFLMIYAAKEILGKKTRVIIEHSINKNYYCEIDFDGKITADLLKQIKSKMLEAVEADLKIEKRSVTVEESLKLAEQFGLYDKIKTMNYRRTSNVNLYKLDWFYDYFYGQMAFSTGRTPHFTLVKEGNGFMLCFPAVKNGEEIRIGHDENGYKKITNVFKESGKWAKILKADTVGALNDIISSGETGRFIMTNEALHEKRIGQIADKISQQGKNIVLIAGPSSSGKTTFAERLSVQLRVNGLLPHVISLDNYYRNRSEVPLEADGKPNLEAVSALDTELLNEHLALLIKGHAIEIPRFSFVTSSREKGEMLELNDDSVLIIEGIHGLNDKLTEAIPAENKFKIFISALTQLNIDDHNRIPTTDTRLIRRIVRDNQFRNHDAEKTIAIWPSVTRGEDEYIFPFQENADAFFNSALVYEMCVLKQYAEPLLFKIQKSSEQYIEARRLVKFLDGFLGISSEDVPKNSILREFVGGSFFNV